MMKGENKFAKGNELKDEMMKISQSEVKIVKEVDTITNILAHPSLYDFEIFYQFSSSTQTFQNRYVDENGVQCMLEEVLSIAAMEAVCERYFRIFSTIVKNPYITTMNAEMVSHMAFKVLIKNPEPRQKPGILTFSNLNNSINTFFLQNSHFHMQFLYSIKML